MLFPARGAAAARRRHTVLSCRLLDEAIQDERRAPGLGEQREIKVFVAFGAHSQGSFLLQRPVCEGHSPAQPPEIIPTLCTTSDAPATLLQHHSNTPRRAFCSASVSERNKQHHELERCRPRPKTHLGPPCTPAYTARLVACRWQRHKHRPAFLLLTIHKRDKQHEREQWKRWRCWIESGGKRGADVAAITRA